MQEPNLLKKKKLSLAGIGIEGAADPSTWTYTSGVHSNNDNIYTFDGTSQVDYIRIPYANTPWPTGENMEIRLKARISQVYDTANNIYFLAKWSGSTSTTDDDWVMQRRSDGKLYFTIASLSGNPIATGVSVPIGQDFEIYWRRLGDQFYAEFNGVQCYSSTFAAQRQAPVDWMIGGYINAANTGVSTNAARAAWSLLGLKINRL